MTAIAAHDHFFTPDDPVRRALWVLPLALLLVLVALLGFSMMLRAPMKKAPPAPPIRAEIYELPGKVGPKPRAKSEAMTRAAPKPAPTRKPAEAVPIPPPPKPEPKPVPPAVVRAAPPAPPEKKTAPKPAVTPEVPKHQGEIVKRAAKPKPPTPSTRPRTPPKAAKAETPKPPPKAAQSEPPKTLNWAQLNAQVNAAVHSTVDRPAVERIRDPDSLVAHYYLASVLSKLERVGQLTYQASMVGQAVVAIEIGPQGELLDLQLTGPSGRPRIDDYAQQIVRMSVPFAPFPPDLERETNSLRIVVHMDFQGYREVEAN